MTTSVSAPQAPSNSLWLPPRNIQLLRAEREEIAPQYPAKAVWRDGWGTYAIDNGFVSFVDGYLCFTGQRSEWAVSSGTQQRKRVYLVPLAEDRLVRITPRGAFWWSDMQREAWNEAFAWLTQQPSEGDRLPPATGYGRASHWIWRALLPLLIPVLLISVLLSIPGGRPNLLFLTIPQLVLFPSVAPLLQNRSTLWPHDPRRTIGEILRRPSSS